LAPQAMQTIQVAMLSSALVYVFVDPQTPDHGEGERPGPAAVGKDRSRWPSVFFAHTLRATSTGQQTVSYPRRTSVRDPEVIS
jgi:hypothetical protein